MTVAELIESLKQWDPNLTVVIWDVEADDWAEVTFSIQEDGSSQVDLGTGEVPEMIEVGPEDQE